VQASLKDLWVENISQKVCYFKDYVNDKIYLVTLLLQTSTTALRNIKFLHIISYFKGDQFLWIVVYLWVHWILELTSTQTLISVCLLSEIKRVDKKILHFCKILNPIFKKACGLKIHEIFHSQLQHYFSTICEGQNCLLMSDTFCGSSWSF
jgi:hypothetical protein